MGQHRIGRRFEPRTQHWVDQIGRGLRDAGHGEFLCRFAATETGDLGEQEPHPVAPFRSGLKLGESLFEDAALRCNEPAEIVAIVHKPFLQCPCQPNGLL